MERRIASIEHGVVIDHIPTNYAISIMNMLSLSEHSNTVTVAFNLDSRKVENKGIIKVSNRRFSRLELDRIALIAEGATINIIENHKVVEKVVLHIPEELTGVAICPNTRCITNVEGNTRFIKIDSKRMKCYFCEKIFSVRQISPQ